MLESAIAALMQAEMEAVLADPLLRRSPVQSRLLRYLVDASIRNDGAQLKSYAIAVDGLGKEADFDSQSDSYARVHVVRLRRTLDAFYAGAGAARPYRLHIESGSYKVTLLPATERATPGHVSQDHAPEPAAEPAAVPAAPGWLRRYWHGPLRLAAIALLAGLVVLALFHLRTTDGEGGGHWKHSDFPFVAVAVSAEDGARDAAMADEVAAARRILLANAARYEGIRTSSGDSRSGDYVIDIALRRNGPETFADVLVTRNMDRRVIWSASERLEPAAADGGAARARALGNLMFRIAQPAGVIHAQERRWIKDVRSPYRCWLRYGAILQDNPFQDDAQLDQCAEAWYRATPNHPVAVALHAWAMTSKANRAISESSRRQQLSAVLSLVEKARSANPNSPLLQATALRAHGLAGDREMVIETAGILQSLNPDGLDVAGASGMYLVFFNVDGGEKLIDKAISGHPNPPAWYHIGKFVAAMMRDDVAGAQSAVTFMEVRKSSGLSLHLIEAALAARRGRLELARAHLHEAEDDLPVMRIRPEMVFRRLPLAPEVRERLRQWLEPVIPRTGGKG